MRVLSVDYSLAPEASVPTAVDEAVNVYRALLAEGTAADQIVFAGESAGGGLAVSAALAVKSAKLPQPAGIAVVSPWIDLTLALVRSETTLHDDPSITVEGLRRSAELYAPNGVPFGSPLDVLNADLTGLASLHIHAGGRDLLLPDAIALTKRAATADVHVTLNVVARAPHAFVNYSAMLGEAASAVAEIARFIDRRATSPDQQDTAGVAPVLPTADPPFSASEEAEVTRRILGDRRHGLD